MRKSVWVWCVVAVLVGLSTLGLQAQKAKKQDKVIIGYILANRGGTLDAATIAAEKMTRINYAFFRVQDGVIGDATPQAAANLAVLTGLKRRNHALQVVVSVGGGGAGSAGFSDMAVTAEGRKKFVDSAMALIEKFNLDGLDVDWEYPGYTHAQGVSVRPEDKDNYTALMRDLKTRFNQNEKRLGRKLYTSSATGATQIWLDHTNMREASKWIDSINMMCYDWYNATEKNTGHDSPLYTNPADPKAISIDNAVKIYVAAGVPVEKIVIGVPFYGRKWVGVEPGTTNGLWQAVADPKKAAPLSTPVYGQIEPMINAQGFVRYWDSVGQAPYLYNAESKTFVTYNDAETELSRAKYIKEKKLQGLMFWQYTGDPNNVLLDAMDKGFGW